MSSTTPAQYALILIDLASEFDVQRDELIAGSQLAGETQQIGARVADADFGILAENGLKLTGEPALGLLCGKRLNLGAHALLGQAFLTCGNLAQVMQLFERYYRVLAQDLHLEFTRDEEWVRIESSHLHPFLPLHFGPECIAAAMRNTLSGLLGDPQFPIRFEFPYPRPAHVDQYERILGSDVHFDCPATRWSFPASMLDRALPSSNPVLRQLYEAECARLLSDLEEIKDVATQTRGLLQKLEGQYPTMPQMAAMLNLSARTYRRRLAENGTRFQALLDQVRAEHATRHLREGHMPVASIAYQLGFNDPANFRRAYRRWTGQTPGSARRAAHTPRR